MDDFRLNTCELCDFSNITAREWKLLRRSAVAGLCILVAVVLGTAAMRANPSADQQAARAAPQFSP